MLPRRTFRRRIAPLVALVLGLGAVNADAQSRKPYTKEAIVGMLKGEVSPKRVTVLARQRGIDFQITSEVEGELRQAGATAELLATLREISPKPPEKPTAIIVQTSPGAEVYVDDQFVGRASHQGRLVVPNPSPGGRTLRVSLAGKGDYEQTVKVTAGETSNVQAPLASIEEPKPKPSVETARRSVSAPVTGTVRENPKDRLKYVWVGPGTFMMGCSPGDNNCFDQEKPAHQVTITRGFWMGQTPVTAGAYKRFAMVTGRKMPIAPDFNNGWGHENMPIVGVNWDDAQAYCRWMGGRLPTTEAEWEYAARGGSADAHYGDLDLIAWYSANSGGQTHDVSQKRANGFGLYDMLGNVWELVNDWFDPNYYRNSRSQDPQGPPGGQYHILRGGSWLFDPRFVRVSYRGFTNPPDSYNVSGFRCSGEVFAP